jgi:hypothetical protein
MTTSKRAIAALSLALTFMVSRAQDPGCTFFGNSACGGDDHGQCAPHERFYSERCENGAVRNKCFVDDYCASVTKGRVNIAGSWIHGSYSIRQSGDTFTITGGGAGPATGQFTGPNTIYVKWAPEPPYSATVAADNNNRGIQINWNRPPGNLWRR